MPRDKINKYIKFDTSILCFCHLFQENNAESLKLSQIIFPKKLFNLLFIGNYLQFHLYNEKII